MKYIFTLFLALVSVSSLHSQITLEHTYLQKDGVYQLIAIDSAEVRYVGATQDTAFHLNFYNLDHTLDRSIHIPPSLISTNSSDYIQIPYIAQNLFSTDGKIGVLFVQRNHITNEWKMLVLNEDLNVLLARDSVASGSTHIYNTKSGTKLLTEDNSGLSTYIYSLPGKLPSSSTRSSVTPSGSIAIGTPSVANAYPNPSTGAIRIEYKLPEAVTNGELLITNTDGVLVRKYKVGDMFNDLLIAPNELPAGAYFYRLITSRGESEMKKLIVVN